MQSAPKTTSVTRSGAGLRAAGAAESRGVRARGPARRPQGDLGLHSQRPGWARGLFRIRWAEGWHGYGVGLGLVVR